MNTARPFHLAHPLLAKCEQSIVLTPAERLALGALPFTIGALESGDVPGWTGDRPARSFIVLEGLLGTSKTLRDGEIQMTAFHVSGDVLGLMALHLEVLDSDIAALTDCKVAFLANSDLQRLCDEHPRIADLLWRTTLVDTAIAYEWLVNVAQRPALNRLAHLFCEMAARMDAVGQVEDGSCQLGLVQRDLGEATGLSLVHINRTVQDLRARGLISFSHGKLTIHDWEGLARLGDFQPDYLHLREPAVPVV